jgi:hypothetical protein
MHNYDQEILQSFRDNAELESAVLSNNAMIYGVLARIIMKQSTYYRAILLKESQKIADQLLMQTLTIFRRQVKHHKTAIRIHKGRVYAGKNRTELSDLLLNLYSQVFQSSEWNTANKNAREFERTLINGRGFSKLDKLKSFVLNTLHESGCKNPEDKEELFNESLLIFWKKLVDGKIGIYFAGSENKPENAHVYNRDLYQQSKLSTFLTGIAKNLFLNKTRTVDFRAIKYDIADFPEDDEGLLPPEETDSQVVVLFHYYRHYVEPRKLRTAISLLQYDCNLEDREVRQLIGINNARIHSSRQRAHFAEWYGQNLSQAARIADASQDYFAKREDQKARINEKILTIDRFERQRVNHIDLNIYREEFRSHPEFNRFHRVFKQAYYLASTGKPSGFSGLPDESDLRTAMEIFKASIFSLSGYQAMLFLLFYGAEEPDETIVSLFRELHLELAGMEPDSAVMEILVDQLNAHLPADPAELADDIYASNTSLFARLSAEKIFTNLAN